MDIIDGFEDLGHLGRTQRRVNKVFVITLNGFHPIHRWRVIAYYGLTHNNVYSEDIATLMRQIGDKAAECGADLKLFVYDQGSPKRAAYEVLDITEKKPFFEHAEKHIFAFHDVLHIVKKIVSGWQRYTILIVLGEEISFQDVISTWNADRGNKLSNTLGYISLEQMFPNNFERQNMRSAFQLVSEKLRSAMAATKEVKVVTSPTIDGTGKLTKLPCFEVLEGTVRGLLAPYRELVSKSTSF